MYRVCILSIYMHAGATITSIHNVLNNRCHFIDEIMWSNVSNHSCSVSSSSSFFKIVSAIRAASGLTSMVFSIFAVVLSVLTKKYLVTHQRTVLYYSVSCTLKGITCALSRVDYFFENEGTRAFCIVEGFADEYAGWMVLLSSLSIAYHLCMEVLGREHGGRCAQRLWLVLIFIFPLTFCWIPFINLAYGQSADWAWCSFRKVLEDCTDFVFARVLYYVLWLVPAIILIVVFFVFYATSVVIVVRRRAQWNPMCNDPDIIKKKKQLEREVATLTLPVLLFFIINIFGFLITITEQTEKRVASLWILYAIVPQLCSGMVAFFMTVDIVSCSAFVRCSYLRSEDFVQEYAIKPAVDGAGSLRRNPPHRSAQETYL